MHFHEGLPLGPSDLTTNLESKSSGFRPRLDFGSVSFYLKSLLPFKNQCLKTMDLRVRTWQPEPGVVN